MFESFKTRRKSRTKFNSKTFPKEMRGHELKNEIDKIKNFEEKIKWKDLKYETKNISVIFSNLKK